MLLIQGVAKQFSDEMSLTFPECELKDGDQCVLVGDSGSGKIRLLHILGGLIYSFIATDFSRILDF